MLYDIPRGSRVVPVQQNDTRPITLVNVSAKVQFMKSGDNIINIKG